MSRIGLGIDAGGSSTGWLLLDGAGETVGRGRVAGITGHLFAADGELSDEGATSLERLAELLDQAAAVVKPGGVVLGIPGLEAGSATAGILAAFIRDRLGEDTRVLVENDMQIAYLSAFEPGEGVIVYGGTGSIAYHVPRHGAPLRAGGHGYLIDDSGGGWWIGRQALQQVLRWHDELGQPAGQPLARAVYAQLGASDWPEIRSLIYGGGRSSVAALAPAVVRAAARGDAAASGILAGAGQELGRLANVLLRRLGQMLPVTLLGGVSRMGPKLHEALAATLPAGTQLQVSQEDPANAAARLALELS